ncbi:uncharacterized protein LOC126622777 [Malus sylvestris]|uniref:uncharacterized protein LOC126622777 n=1 Tax=Malus sylvestris TaxID=3752 RepID=UPI0021ACC869|nr:uncharacterized protein LOC126622777 [Malus sylvestris]
MTAFYRRKYGSSPLCHLCNSQEESIEHLFLLCPSMETIWFGGVLNCKVNRNEITTWTNWLLAIIKANKNSKADMERILPFVAFLCWHIWKARCCLLFQQQQINPSQVLAVISTNVSAFLEASRAPIISVVQSRPGNHVQARWTKLRHPFVKINVDASWVAATNDGFAGVVVRDFFGSFTATQRYRFNAHSVAATKVMSILRGCGLGLSLGLNYVVVEFDLLDSISCLRGKITNGK